MAWVLLFTAAGVAVARYATLPAGFLAAAFAAATLMAFITYRRRIGNGYIAIALLLLGMALPALRPQPAYGPAGMNRLHEAASERIRRISRGAGRRGDARGRPADGVHARHILRASEEARGPSRWRWPQATRRS